MRASLSCDKRETWVGETSQKNVDSILISLNRARTKLHASTGQRRQTIPIVVGGTTAANLLRPVHEFLRLIRRSSIDDIADVILVDAFDLHTRRRSQVGEVDDIIVTVFMRGITRRSRVSLHAVDCRGGKRHLGGRAGHGGDVADGFRLSSFAGYRRPCTAAG